MKQKKRVFVGASDKDSWMLILMMFFLLISGQRTTFHV